MGTGAYICMYRKETVTVVLTGLGTSVQNMTLQWQGYVSMVDWHMNTYCCFTEAVSWDMLISYRNCTEYKLFVEVTTSLKLHGPS